MADHYMHTILTPSVRSAQQHYYQRDARLGEASQKDLLTEEEALFISARDSFYLATVNEDGWPYVQHRGGAPGFLKVLGASRLGFADLKGNRQLLSTGNINTNSKTALFLMDYPRQERLKIIGHTQIWDARTSPELLAQVATPETQNLVERIFVMEVIGFDWNCPKYITPRFTAREVEEAIKPLKQRISELEAQISRLMQN